MSDFLEVYRKQIIIIIAIIISKIINKITIVNLRLWESY